MAEANGTSQASKNLKDALASGLNLTTGTVKNTLDLTNKAVAVATKITGTTINAAGVLGDDTVKATQAIGSAAMGTVATVSGKSLETGAKIADASLSAAGTITSAAASATTKIAETAIDTTASAVSVTTEQVGKSMEAAVNLVGNSITRTANGIDNLGAMVSGRGALVVKNVLQKQGAEAIGIDARQSKDIKDRLLQTFDLVEKQTKSTLEMIHGIQKTALAAQINIYKRAKCGFFKRLTGFCDAGTIGRDMKLADMYINDLLTTLKTVGGEAKTAISAASDASPDVYRTIENKYNTAAANAINTFVTNYRSLLDKYNKLSRSALGMSGGRYKKTYRKKKRSIRVSRRRPSVRGRSA